MDLDLPQHNRYLIIQFSLEFETQVFGQFLKKLLKKMQHKRVTQPGYHEGKMPASKKKALKSFIEAACTLNLVCGSE